MKFCFLSFFLLFGALSFSSEKAFLKCLGKEELHYHKNNIGGPDINLNKKIIGEFIQTSETLSLKDKFQKKICNSKKFRPSLMTLYIILKYQDAAFALRAHKQDIAQHSKDIKTRGEVIKNSFFALIDFINDIQARAKKPDCIIRKVPELKNLYIKSKYTLEDIGVRKIINEISDLENIFDQISDPDILKGCL